MWSPDCHPERPWWTLCVVDGEPVQTSFPARYVMQWRRVDGKTVRVGYQSANPDWRTTVFQHEAELAAIDAAHPLPHPGYYPGQVWVLDDDEVTICRVKHRDARVEAYVSPDYGAIDYSKDLLDGAILVAGPTPWGRDCPWSPA